jgi:SAM-dependent methyltransferase
VSNEEITRRTYADPQFVKAFLAKNWPRSQEIEVAPHVREFAESLDGKRIIDIGCGPGIHARQFAALGLQVVAIDYSESMIQAAISLAPNDNPPSYRTVDMRNIGDAFAPNSFDGAWVSASLIHVPEANVPGVLNGIHRILAPGGHVRISLKAGDQRAELVYDDKYGIGVEREFVFWEEHNMVELLYAAGFEITSIQKTAGGITGTETTKWLIFGARVVKG